MRYGAVVSHPRFRDRQSLSLSLSLSCHHLVTADSILSIMIAMSSCEKNNPHTVRHRTPSTQPHNIYPTRYDASYITSVMLRTNNQISLPIFQCSFAVLHEQEEPDLRRRGMWSLADLCAQVLDLDLAKPDALRKGSWEKRPLNVDQLFYAAADAYAGLRIWQVRLGSSWRYDRFGP